MEVWILIMTLVTYGGAVTISSVPIGSKMDCMKASNEWIAITSSKVDAKAISAICVKGSK